MPTQERIARVQNFVAELIGMDCLDARTGGLFPQALTVDFGADQPLSPSTKTKLEHRAKPVTPIARLYVWCVWRLDDSNRPLASGDQSRQVTDPVVKRLVGSSIVEAMVTSPAFDLRIATSTGLRLTVFCEYLPPDPTFDGNWELVLRDMAASIGPGDKVEFEECDYPIREHGANAP